MRLLPRRLVPRIAVALVFAALAVVALRLLIDRPDAALAAAPAAPPVGEPAHAAVLATLAGRAERIVLAESLARVPAEVAPVLVLGKGGALRVARRPPAPRAPVEVWPEAAVVLGHASLDALDPAERAVLLDTLVALTGRTGIQPAALVGAGVVLERAQVDELLRWAR